MTTEFDNIEITDTLDRDKSGRSRTAKRDRESDARACVAGDHRRSVREARSSQDSRQKIIFDFFKDESAPFFRFMSPIGTDVGVGDQECGVPEVRSAFRRFTSAYMRRLLSRWF